MKRPVEEMNSLLMGVSASNSLVKEAGIYLFHMRVKIDWSLVPEKEYVHLKSK